MAGVLENVVQSAGLRYVALVQDGKTILAAGPPPNASFWTEPTGSLLSDQTFHVWRTVRIQDCPTTGGAPGGPWGQGGHGQGQGQGRGRGGPGWRERAQDEPDAQLAESSQVLAIGLDPAPYQQQLDSAARRLTFTAGLGALAIVVLVLAWMLSLRHRRLAVELSAVRARAAALEEMSLAAAGLAHEIKNPLGIARGQAQTLANGNASAAPAVAETIMEEVDIAISRLGEFLAYAKPRTPTIADLPAAPLLDRAASLLKPDFDGAGATLDVQAEPLSVRADGEMFQQVLVNVLLNALQAVGNAAAKRVTLRLHRDERSGTARLAITDSGPGISPDVQRDLFKPYVSGRPGGHGLGLAVVKRIVEQHGWSIAVSSPPGQGATVEVTGIGLARSPRKG
jgi:signal transduction histidine kinase